MDALINDSEYNNLKFDIIVVFLKNVRNFKILSNEIMTKVRDFYLCNL